MKGTHNFALMGVTCSTKKSSPLILMLKCFNVPGDIPIQQHAHSFHKTVTGSHVDLTVRYLQSRPVTVSFYVLDFDCGGRLTGLDLSLHSLALGGRSFFIPHFVKEYNVTLTNHARDIETFANDVVHHVDRKEYGRAHIVLDDIEKKVRTLHRHIDRLQNIGLFAERPAGGS